MRKKGAFGLSALALTASALTGCNSVKTERSEPYDVRGIVEGGYYVPPRTITSHNVVNGILVPQTYSFPGELGVTIFFDSPIDRRHSWNGQETISWKKNARVVGTFRDIIQVYMRNEDKDGDGKNDEERILVDRKLEAVRKE